MNDPRVIPGFSIHYRACADGWVWSEFVRGSKRTGPWKRLKAAVSTNGYRATTFKTDDGRSFRTYLHRLVALAFLGPPPEGCEVRHLNGDPLDNRAENLAWGTRKQNLTDCLAHGTLRGRPGHWNIGPDNPVASLNADRVRMARQLFSVGYPKKAIAAALGVSPPTISNLILGKSYREVI